MVWIDIVLIIIILWFAYKGFRNGFIIELTTLIALILAVWGALKYVSLTSSLLRDQLGLEGGYLPFVSFIITFIIILILVSFIGRLITKALQLAQLGILNRLLGLLFAILKIGIILSLTINGLDRVNQRASFIKKETINNSFLYQPLNGFAENIYKFSNENFDKIKNKIDDTFETTEGTEV